MDWRGDEGSGLPSEEFFLTPRSAFVSYFYFLHGTGAEKNFIASRLEEDTFFLCSSPFETKGQSLRGTLFNNAKNWPILLLVSIFALSQIGSRALSTSVTCDARITPRSRLRSHSRNTRRSAVHHLRCVNVLTTHVCTCCPEFKIADGHSPSSARPWGGGGCPLRPRSQPLSRRLQMCVLGRKHMPPPPTGAEECGRTTWLLLKVSCSTNSTFIFFQCSEPQWNCLQTLSDPLLHNIPVFSEPLLVPTRGSPSHCDSHFWDNLVAIIRRAATVHDAQNFTKFNFPSNPQAEGSPIVGCWKRVRK